MPAQRRTTIDLTQDTPYSTPTEVIDLTEDEDQETLVDEPVSSLLLTYPRILDQMERAGIQLMPDGSVKYWEFEQLCQSGSIKDFFLNHLLQLDPQPAYILVAKENHKDETPHIHCMVQWIGKHTFPNDYFDFHGMHPNLLKLNKPKGAKAYCLKDDKSALRWVKCFDLEDDDEGFFTASPPPYSKEE